MKKCLGFSLIAIGTLMGSSFQYAQAQPPAEPVNTQQNQQAPGQRNASDSQKMMSLDQHIASCLLFGNQEEIAMAEFAESHASSDDVKSFAKMLIEDHKQAVQKLQKFAPHAAQLASGLRDGGDRDHKSNKGSPESSGNRNLDGNGNQSSSSKTAGNPQVGQQPGQMMQQMLLLEKRVHEECLAMTQKELGMMKGEKFDHAYLGSQVGAHIGMLAKLKGSEDFASTELRQVLTDCQTTVMKHKEKAEELMKESKEHLTSTEAKSSN